MLTERNSCNNNNKKQTKNDANSPVQPSELVAEKSKEINYCNVCSGLLLAKQEPAAVAKADKIKKQC